jgi:hypothetical protein
MAATVEFSNDARRMIDDDAERWVAEHGYFASNPLVEEAEHTTEQLRHIRSWACDSVELEAAGLRSGACCFKQAGTSTTASMPAGPTY